MLPNGSDDDVRRQVKQRIQTFAPGGGFIFSHIHDIVLGVPPQNILAMVDTAREYGQYPLRAEE